MVRQSFEDIDFSLILVRVKIESFQQINDWVL